MSLETLAELDAVAQRYGQRPSAMLGIDDPLLAYHVDRLAAHAGIWQEQQWRAEKPTDTKRHRDDGAVFSLKEGLRGRLPVVEMALPDWLEAKFREGPIVKAS